MWVRRNARDARLASGLPLCRLAILWVLLLSGCAFLLPDGALPLLILLNIPLLLQGSRLGAGWRGLLMVFAVQLAVTCGLYWLLYGADSLADAAIVIARLMLALIPGWWLSARFAPEQLGAALGSVLPGKWAFVLAATLSLLPHIQREAAEIYRLQCLRGAPITPRALRNPKNWLELGPCLLFPLLIELMKLSRQQALAARSRQFGCHPHPTHWPSDEE
ncbi:cobalt ABC transporter permease [Shewanella sp. GXUN23E]|uniref:cobalt ABC transporter permease n=1 Tax=Shewanella sp. GXUN23E TaxID=3422498 RepID=UPI003D7C6989